MTKTSERKVEKRTKKMTMKRREQKCNKKTITMMMMLTMTKTKTTRRMVIRTKRMRIMNIRNMRIILQRKAFVTHREIETYSLYNVFTIYTIRSLCVLQRLCTAKWTVDTMYIYLQLYLLDSTRDIQTVKSNNCFSRYSLSSIYPVFILQANVNFSSSFCFLIRMLK